MRNNAMYSLMRLYFVLSRHILLRWILGLSRRYLNQIWSVQDFLMSHRYICFVLKKFWPMPKNLKVRISLGNGYQYCDMTTEINRQW